MAESSGRDIISSLSNGKISCYWKVAYMYTVTEKTGILILLNTIIHNIYI